MPMGFYDMIVIECNEKGNFDSLEQQTVGKGIDSISCFLLTPGSFISVKVYAFKNSNGQESSDYYTTEIKTGFSLFKNVKIRLKRFLNLRKLLSFK